MLRAIRCYSCHSTVFSPVTRPVAVRLLHSPPQHTIVRKLKEKWSSSAYVSSPQADIFNSTLSRIRQALENNDTSAVMDYWRHLEKNNLLQHLRLPEYSAISRLLANTFLSRSSADNPCDPFILELAENAALFTAKERSTEALEACMLTYIRQNNPDAVISLYQRFMDSLGAQNSWEESSDERSSNSGLAIDAKSATGPLPQMPERAPILLAVTTAHAMQDSFTDALKTCLETHIRFYVYSSNKFLRKLSFNPRLRDKMEGYIRRLDVARLVARPPSLSKQITNLSTTAHTTKSLESLYSSIIEGLTGPDAYLAADPALTTATKIVALTEVGWTSFMVGFLKCQRRDLAAKIWSDMAQFGLKPGVSMWTALLDAYDGMLAVDEAKAAWNRMGDQGIEPSGLTYRAMISILFRTRKADEAVYAFGAFKKHTMPNSPASETLSVYNTMLHGFLSLNLEGDATKLLQEMEEQGPTPDLVSYNTFLAYHARRGDFKSLASLIDKMSSINLAGDVFSFSTILSALLRAGREDAPTILLGIMRKHGVEPNVATYSAIIDHQMREQDERHLRAALRILQEMEQDPSLSPNEVTYTSILTGLYRGNWLPRKAADLCRQDIVERMKKRCVKFHLPTYHILLKTSLEYPLEDGLRDALSYYQQMMDEGVKPAVTTWYILLSGLVQRGEWVKANEILGDMISFGVRPRGSMTELVRTIRKQAVYLGVNGRT